MQTDPIHLNSNLKESKSKLLVLNEIVCLIQEFKNKVCDENTSSDSFIFATGALLSLTHRRLCPLASPELRAFLEYILNSESSNPIIFDNSKFATAISSIANHPDILRMSNNEQFQMQFLALYKKLKEKSDWHLRLKDPLLVGWINQVVNNNRDNYEHRRQKKSLGELSNLTQWYTPEWIAKILVNQVTQGCSNNQEIQFLDPACGAGHLLVPAFQKLYQESDKSINSINHILKNQLFGLDIDCDVLKIAGFSLYLAVKDVEPEHDFPLPNLYSFKSDTVGGAYGSYCLGVNEKLENDQILVGLDQTVKSLKNLPKRFSAIAANPPYLSNRLIPKPLKTYLKKHFKDSHYDLYTSFLELSIKLLKESGKASFICQQSFLSIRRYESLRKKLLNDVCVLTVAQLGKGIFATRSGEKVNSAILTIANQSKNSNSTISILEKDGSYLRKKIRSYNEIEQIANSIPGYPIAVWCPIEVANYFNNYPPMESEETGITCTNGLFTCNNKRFVKHYSEVNETNRNNFVPYDKGGAKKWFYTTPYFLEWIDNGQEIRQYRKNRGQSVSLPGEEFYFKPGITYSYIGPSGFKARLLSPNSIFDIASSAIFSKDDNLLYLLGFLNSSLTRYILGILNPTVNFQIGDLRKLPYIVPDQKTKDKVSTLSQRAITIAQQFEKYNYDSPVFDRNLFETYGSKEKKFKQLKNKIIQAANEENEIQEKIDSAIFSLYKVSPTLKDIIQIDPWVKNNQFSQVKNINVEDTLKLVLP